MEQRKFDALLPLIVPRVVTLIAEKESRNEVAVSREFYESEVYATLEQEETKLWHLSPMMLFSMYDEERRTGKIVFPEG